jgi:RNA polymerase sigma-54 factor
MKQGLHLQLGQQLKMTPQLQQAIRLLQLSALDLRQEIQDTVESNPLLEMEDEADSFAADGEVETPSQQGDRAELDLDATDNFADDLQVDTDWDDIYPGSSGSGSGSGSGSSGTDEDGDSWEARNASPESFQQHLLWQLNLTPMSEADRAIAEAIIDALDERGYLIETLEDIRAAVQPLGLKPDDPLFPEDDEIVAVLHRLQHFDPPGVAARDLSECLSIQLNMLDEETPWRRQALQLVNQHLGLLESRDFDTLRRRMNLTDEQLAEVMRLIRGLNPAPGELVSDSSPEYIVPDVVVSRRGKRWLVELNPESMPKVRINDHYAGMIRHTRREEDGSYLKAQLQEAKWFLKSLQSRNETLLKVATRIVEVQQGFFEYGEEAMKPLVLAEIADAVGMHESTISRVTNQKYMHTPKGVFELKYFFSSHVGTDGGGECSSTAIRAIIKKLVAAEDARKPLSDNKLADLLNEQGIQVARRTVAKYREAMRIPASSDRKRLV